MARRSNVTNALKRLQRVTPSDRKLGTSREIANAAYRAFRLGTITKRQAYALGVVGAVLMKPLDERSESTDALRRRKRLKRHAAQQVSA